MMILVLLLAGGPLPAAFDLSPAERAQLGGDKIVARVEIPDHSEVALLAAVRVRTTPEAFRRCALDPRCLKDGENLLAAGRFSATPLARELEAVPLEEAELQPLRDCRPGDCRFRLSAEAMEGLRRAVDWSKSRPADAAARYLRAMLLAQAEAYLAEGNRALPRYENNDHPVHSGESLQELLARPLFLLDQAPELRRYLSAFPSPADADSLQEYLCWSKEKIWGKRVVALDHVMVQEQPEGEAFRIVVASKKIYATHYFDSSLELLALEGKAGDDAATLILSSRSRADIRTSGFTWYERLLVRHFGRGRLEDHLLALKRRLEQPTPVAALP
jgi:hypothetical protein